MGVQIPFSFLKSLDFKPLQTKVRVLPWQTKSILSSLCFSLICPEIPCFARFLGDFVICSEITECGKSEQTNVSYYYLLVVKLVVKRVGLLLSILQWQYSICHLSCSEPTPIVINFIHISVCIIIEGNKPIFNCNL